VSRNAPHPPNPPPSGSCRSVEPNQISYQSIEEDFYDAFISYRHVEQDRKWARWLEQAIETYRVPRKLVRSAGIAPRVRRVFRDEDELPASPDLNEQIEQALGASKFLIVVCSRRTPESKWVDTEVRRFRELGRGERILALLTDGEPAEAFPRSLREIRRETVAGDGQTREEVQEVEPLAADVRPVRTESPRYLKRMALLRVVSSLLGCRFDELRQREQERRTHRLAVAGGLLVLLVAVMTALAGVALWQKKEADRQRGFAETQRAEAVRQSAEAQQQRNEAQKQRKNADTQRALADDRRQQAEDALQRERAENYYNVIALCDQKISDALFGQVRGPLWRIDPSFRGWEWGRLMYRCESDMRTLKGVFSDVRGVAFSPDGRRLAVVGRDRGLILYDVATAKVLLDMKDAPVCDSVAFSPDGVHVAAVSSTANTITVYDSGTGRVEWSLGAHRQPPHNLEDFYVQGVSYSRDGTRLASGGSGMVWDARTGKKLQQFTTPTRGIREAAISPDGTRLVAENSLWDVATGKSILTLDTPRGLSATCVAWSPKGTRVATGITDGEVYLWDARTGAAGAALNVRRGMPRAVAFSSDGARVATGWEDNTVSVWDAETGRELFSLAGHSGEVRTVAFSPRGDLLASGSADGTVRLWDATRDRSTLVLGDKQSPGDFAAMSPGGDRVASVGEHEVAVWDARTAERRCAQSAETTLNCVAWSPSGENLVTGELTESRYPYSSGQAVLRDANTGKAVRRLTQETGAVHCVSFSPDGRYIIVGGDTESAIVVEVQSGQTIRRVRPGNGSVYAVAWSPDGRRIATAATSDNLVVWDARTGERAWSGSILTSHRGGYSYRVRRGTGGLAFSNDSRLLASSGIGMVACVWDVATGKRLQTFSGHSQQIYCAAFSPDATRLATGSGDQTVRIWNVAAGRELILLRGHAREVTSVAFSARGDRLMSASGDGTARIWMTVPLDLTETTLDDWKTRRREGRETPDEFNPFDVPIPNQPNPFETPPRNEQNPFDAPVKSQRNSSSAPARNERNPFDDP